MVKTRLQKQRGFAADRKYKGMFHGAVTIVSEEGATALWKGAVPTMARNGSNQACNFFTVGIINKQVWGRTEGDGKDFAVWKSMITGYLAGTVGPVMNNPMDVVKTRLMAQEGKATKYRGLCDCLVKVVREEGPAALWAGLLPRVLRTAGGQAIMWTVITQMTVRYEQLYMGESDGGGSSRTTS